MTQAETERNRWEQAGAAVDADLLVGALPEPTPPPWGEDGAVAGDATEAATDAAPPLTREQAADMLAAAVQLPFALAAIFRGEHGIPAAYWELSDAEAMSVAVPLARAVPPSWLLDRLMAVSPWLVAAAALYNVTTPRLAIDRELAKAKNKEAGKSDARADEGPTQRAGTDEFGSRAAGAPDGGTERAANPAGFDGAGFGFPPSGRNQSGAAPRQRRDDAGRFVAAPAN